jgi:PPOX class probable F420-dependent enzyme
LPIKLTEKAIQLVEGRNFAFLAIVLPNETPHVSPVWVDHQGDILLVNTAVGRVKQKHATKGKRVSIAIADQNNMYDKVIIQGRVIDQTQEGADDLIDKLANKYTGAKKYERSSPTEKRVTIKIEPLRIST